MEDRHNSKINKFYDFDQAKTLHFLSSDLLEEKASWTINNLP